MTILCSSARCCKISSTFVLLLRGWQAGCAHHPKQQQIGWVELTNRELAGIAVFFREEISDHEAELLQGDAEFPGGLRFSELSLGSLLGEHHLVEL